MPARHFRPPFLRSSGSAAHWNWAGGLLKSSCAGTSGFRLQHQFVVLIQLKFRLRHRLFGKAGCGSSSAGSGASDATSAAPERRQRGWVLFGNSCPQRPISSSTARPVSSLVDASGSANFQFAGSNLCRRLSIRRCTSDFRCRCAHPLPQPARKDRLFEIEDSSTFGSAATGAGSSEVARIAGAASAPAVRLSAAGPGFGKFRGLGFLQASRPIRRKGQLSCEGSATAEWVLVPGLPGLLDTPFPERLFPQRGEEFFDFGRRFRMAPGWLPREHWRFDSGRLLDLAQSPPVAASLRHRCRHLFVGKTRCALKSPPQLSEAFALRASPR